MGNQYPLRSPALLAGDHDIASPWQRFTNRFIGLPTHNYRFTPGDRPKVLQIFWQSPWQLVIAPNNMVACSSNDKRYVQFRPQYHKFKLLSALLCADEGGSF